MKTKSKSGFIVGLLGLIAGIPIGFYAYIVFALIFGLSKASDLYGFSIYMLPLAGAIVVIALLFFFKKAKVGGILMLIASIIYLIPFILLIILKGFAFTENIFILIIGIFPAIMFVISAILGLKAKSLNPPLLNK